MFLGNAPDQLAAKTAQGIVHWRPDWCVGQMRLEGCQADLQLPDMSLDGAVKAGGKTVIVGGANRRGALPPDLGALLNRALALGLGFPPGLEAGRGDYPPLHETPAPARP